MTYQHRLAQRVTLAMQRWAGFSWIHVVPCQSLEQQRGMLQAGSGCAIHADGTMLSLPKIPAGLFLLLLQAGHSRVADGVF